MYVSTFAFFCLQLMWYPLLDVFSKASSQATWLDTGKESYSTREPPPNYII